MILRVGDKKVIFALSDAMKHSLNSNDTYFNMDMTNSLIDDFVHDMVHTIVLEELLDNPQEEETFPLLPKDEVEAWTCKKHWKVVTQERKGKNKPLLKKIESESFHAIGKIPIYSDFGHEHFFGETNFGVGEYSYLEPS